MILLEPSACRSPSAADEFGNAGQNSAQRVECQGVPSATRHGTDHAGALSGVGRRVRWSATAWKPLTRNQGDFGRPRRRCVDFLLLIGGGVGMAGRGERILKCEEIVKHFPDVRQDRIRSARAVFSPGMNESENRYKLRSNIDLCLPFSDSFTARTSFGGCPHMHERICEVVGRTSEFRGHDTRAPTVLAGGVAFGNPLSNWRAGLAKTPPG
jgi:hypothetical protein